MSEYEVRWYFISRNHAENWKWVCYTHKTTNSSVTQTRSGILSVSRHLGAQLEVQGPIKSVRKCVYVREPLYAVSRVLSECTAAGSHSVDP